MPGAHRICGCGTYTLPVVFRERAGVCAPRKVRKHLLSQRRMQVLTHRVHANGTRENMT